MYQLKVLVDSVTIEGPVCVERFPTKKCKALLCYLASASSHRARRATVIADLWPEEFEEVARKALRQTLYHLRATLRQAGVEEEIVQSAGEYVSLCADRVEVDLDRFCALAAVGLEETDSDRSLSVLGEALTVCPAGFSGCDDGVWVAAPRERVADILRRVRLRIARIQLERGEAQCAHDRAMAIVAEHPFDETAYEIAIRARLLTRDRTGARELFERLHAEFEAGIGEPLSLRWEDLAASCPAPDPVEVTDEQPRSKPRRTRRFPQWAIAVCLSLVALGGWRASEVLGVERAPRLDPAHADSFLRAALREGVPGAEKRRIAAVRNLMEAAWTGAYGADEDEWAEVVHRQSRTILQALRDATKSDPDSAVAIGGAAWRYLVNDGSNDGVQDCLRTALRNSKPKATSARGRALCALSFDTSETGQPDEALGIAREALDVYRALGDKWGEAHAYRAVGFASAFKGDVSSAQRNYRLALEGFEKIGCREGVAVTQLCLAFATPEIPQKTVWSIESLESYVAVDNKWGLEYSADGVRTLVLENGHARIDRDHAVRAVAGLEHVLADLSNPFGIKALETRHAIVKVAMSFRMEDKLSRQLQWLVSYGNLDLETAATMYGAFGASSGWTWMEERIRADHERSGRLTKAVERGRQIRTVGAAALVLDKSFRPGR